MQKEPDDELPPKSTTSPSWMSRGLSALTSLFHNSNEAKPSEAGLNDEQAEELRMTTTFDDRELRRLCGRFLHLDRQSKGYVGLNDVLSMPEFACCPFRDRLRVMFMASLTSPQIEFRKFVGLLSAFGSGATHDQKLRCWECNASIEFIVVMYDFDDDGVVSRVDLKLAIETVVQAISEGDDKNDMADRIATKVMEECSPEKSSGRLLFRDFREALGDSDIDIKVRLLL